MGWHWSWAALVCRGLMVDREHCWLRPAPAAARWVLGMVDKHAMFQLNPPTVMQPWRTSLMDARNCRTPISRAGSLSLTVSCGRGGRFIRMFTLYPRHGGNAPPGCSASGDDVTTAGLSQTALCHKSKRCELGGAGRLTTQGLLANTVPLPSLPMGIACQVTLDLQQRSLMLELPLEGVARHGATNSSSSSSSIGMCAEVPYLLQFPFRFDCQSV